MSLPAINGGYLADTNIFTQIGFVVLVGPVAKNAILIVELFRAKRTMTAQTR